MRIASGADMVRAAVLLLCGLSSCGGDKSNGLVGHADGVDTVNSETTTSTIEDSGPLADSFDSDTQPDGEGHDVEVDSTLPPLDPDLDEDGDGVKNGLDGCARGETGWTSADVGDFDRDGCRDATEDDDDDQDGVSDGNDRCATLDDRFSPVDFSFLEIPVPCTVCTSQRRVEYTQLSYLDDPETPLASWDNLTYGYGVWYTIPVRTDATPVTLVDGVYYEDSMVGYGATVAYSRLYDEPPPYPSFRRSTVAFNSFEPLAVRTTILYDDGVCEWAEGHITIQQVEPRERNLRFELRAPDGSTDRLRGWPALAHGRATDPDGDSDGDGFPEPWEDRYWVCTVLGGGVEPCIIDLDHPANEPHDWSTQALNWGLPNGNPIYLPPTEPLFRSASILVKWPFGTAVSDRSLHLVVHSSQGGPIEARLYIDDALVFERAMELPPEVTWYIGEMIHPGNILLPVGLCTASLTRCAIDADCQIGRTCDDHIIEW